MTARNFSSKRAYRNMKKRNMLIILGIFIFSLVFISAAWFFMINGTASINIASIGSYKEATLNFPTLNLNTTNGSARSSAVVDFVYNRAGTFNVRTIDTMADLSNGECLDGMNDCEIEYWVFDGIQNNRVYNNQNITFVENSNVKHLGVNISCMAYSCPQTRDISFQLNQVA